MWKSGQTSVKLGYRCKKNVDTGRTLTLSSFINVEYWDWRPFISLWTPGYMLKPNTHCIVSMDDMNMMITGS